MDRVPKICPKCKKIIPPSGMAYCLTGNECHCGQEVNISPKRTW